jgi:hypothetical protein
MLGRVHDELWDVLDASNLHVALYDADSGVLERERRVERRELDHEMVLRLPAWEASAWGADRG